MIPYILVAIGGYLIGNSRKAERYSDGGNTPRVYADEIVKRDDKYVVVMLDYETDKLVEEKVFDNLEEAQVFKLDSGSSGYKIGDKTIDGQDVLNIGGWRAFVGESDDPYAKSTYYTGQFENYDDEPVEMGETKEEVISLLEDKVDWKQLRDEDAGEMRCVCTKKAKIGGSYFFDGTKYDCSFKSDDVTVDIDYPKRSVQMSKDVFDEHFKVLSNRRLEMANGGELSKYVITYDDGDDISRIWVYANNEEDAKDKAFEDHWGIEEIISVEKMKSDGGMMAKGGKTKDKHDGDMQSVQVYYLEEGDVIIDPKTNKKKKIKKLDKWFAEKYVNVYYEDGSWARIGTGGFHPNTVEKQTN